MALPEEGSRCEISVAFAAWPAGEAGGEERRAPRGRPGQRESTKLGAQAPNPKDRGLKDHINTSPCVYSHPEVDRIFCPCRNHHIFLI